MPETLGYKIKGASSWNIGKFFACRHVCPKNGILNSISVYLFNDSGSTQKIQLGIYSDVSGTPGKRLISTISVSIPAGFNTWRTIVLTAFLNLGSAYWLTLQLENSAAIVYVYYDAGDEEQQAYKEDWDFGTWPDNPVGLSYYANQLSIYATYTLVPVSPYNWGLLSKNQIDPEKIESAINRIVAEHNDDEQAHIGEGRSLDQHKLSDVIDHVVASIIADKIKDGEVSGRKFTGSPFFIHTIFESKDGWWVVEQAGCWADWHLGGAKLVYGGEVANIGHYVKAYNLPFGSTHGYRSEKNPIFETVARSLYAEDVLIYFGLGDHDVYFMGFKILNNKLYAIHVKAGIEYTTEITGVNFTTFHKYKVVETYLTKIEFYVDDVLRATHTTNLADASEDQFFDLYLKGTAEGEQYFAMYYLFGSQDQ